MRIQLPLITFFVASFLVLSAQESKIKKFKQLSCPEKRWVIWHPFVAKRALKISKYTQKIVREIEQDSILKGKGNGDQIDAFRHTFWMANLTQEIGWRKAGKLGKAHEKGNYRDYKKHRKEDGDLPDKISSEMDLYNNNVGVSISKMTDTFEFKNLVIEAVLQGKCKIIKKDGMDNFLDCEGNVIPKSQLKGKWENKKCLVSSKKSIS